MCEKDLVPIKESTQAALTLDRYLKTTMRDDLDIALLVLVEQWKTELELRQRERLRLQHEEMKRLSAEGYSRKSILEHQYRNAPSVPADPIVAIEKIKGES